MRDMRHCRFDWFYICFGIAITGPPPISPKQVPPPHLLFPTAVARKQLSIWGNHEKTRERSTLNETLARAPLSSLVINGVLSCRLPLPGI